MYLAHSADDKKGVPPQEYKAHVEGVRWRSMLAAKAISEYMGSDRELFLRMVELATEYHDLGKLDELNQEVLAGLVRARKLPVQHTDAGTALLLKRYALSPGAVLVRSHHIGLPDFVCEKNRSEEELFRDMECRDRVNSTLDCLFELHQSLAPTELQSMKPGALGPTGKPSLLFRLALSCLVDADHADTAVHYGAPDSFSPSRELLPVARLNALDRYVEALSKGDDERSQLRKGMYHACRNARVSSGIVSCDSPVGSGKTTAVLAHLLKRAIDSNLRRIFVVLPYTNIISQSVKLYREALTLEGEHPEEVVAELHHRAEFEDLQSRHLTAQWNAPIIVTTAVAFYEALASNSPAAMRRLHRLPGSAVFVDESHAALPANLLPVAWEWMKSYAKEWGCYWVMASGSLNRFWQIPECDPDPPVIPEIVPRGARSELLSYEEGRITYKYDQEPKTAMELTRWVKELPGPRVVILNTVQSAAAAAHEYEKHYGPNGVEHLSTALTPRDRKETLKRIDSRLQKSGDTDWTLFATSCVEAGVDLSFRTGVRELCSLVSLLQTAGRVNRHGMLSDSAVWTIRLADGGLFRQNPMMKNPSKVLKEILDAGVTISPELCTNALQRELRMSGVFHETLKEHDKNMSFPQVEDEFKVIASDTRLVVVDEEMRERIKSYERVEWTEIQQSSVQIWGHRLEVLKIPEFDAHPGLYEWSYDYDSFLGYMKGLLRVEEFVTGQGSII